MGRDLALSEGIGHTRVRAVPADHPIAERGARVIRVGDLEGLRGLLAEHPEFATARFGDETISRTALHAVTDC